MTQAMTLKAYDTLPAQTESVERDGYAYFPGYLDADAERALRRGVET